jgi:ABC-2 type transport system permease protein
MSVFATLLEVSVRGLLGRRRTLLLVLLAALPVVVALLARLGGGRLEVEPILDAMVVRVVLPLTALVFGTSALGAELEDGTALYLLAKPVPRWQVVAAKVVVAGSLSGGLTAGATLLTGLLVGGLEPGSLALTLAFAVAVGITAFVYCALFVAASVLTSRALIVGLVYVFLWEGILAGVLEGTRFFSVREATLGVAAALAPAGSAIDGGLPLSGSIIFIVIVIGGAFVLAARRLGAWEARGAE